MHVGLYVVMCVLVCLFVSACVNVVGFFCIYISLHDEVNFGSMSFLCETLHGLATALHRWTFSVQPTRASA